MIEWNKELGVLIQIFLMVLTLFFLILRRNQLGKSINYFISAISLGCGIEIFNFVSKYFDEEYNSVPVYIIGVNLIIFFIFFLYFYQLLEVKRFKRIGVALIVIFLLGYFISAIAQKDFFNSFPFVFYCAEVALLSMIIFLVLWQTFNSDRILKLKSYYPFWVSIGLMVIYLGVVPLLIVSNTAKTMMNLNIFFIILFAVNVIGYSILLTGIFYAKNTEI